MLRLHGIMDVMAIIRACLSCYSEDVEYMTYDGESRIEFTIRGKSYLLIPKEEKEEKDNNV